MAAPAKITQADVDAALERVLKHARFARHARLDDNRERSADIRRSVHRLELQELRQQYAIIQALARYVPTQMIPRDKQRDLYDVGHAIRGEYWERDRPAREGT